MWKKLNHAVYAGAILYSLSLAAKGVYGIYEDARSSFEERRLARK